MAIALAAVGLLTGGSVSASAAPRRLGPQPAARTTRPTPTLAVSLGSGTPEQSLATAVTLSGTASGDSDLLALVRPAGTAGCARNFTDDRHANHSGSVVLADPVSEEEGPYAATVSWTPATAGAYLVCAWLKGRGSVGPVSLPVSVRGPQVPVLSVGFSSPPTANITFNAEYTVQTDQPLRLLSTIRPSSADSPACGATQSADTTANPGERVIFNGGVPVSGGPSTTSISMRYPAGAYLICSWIIGPGSTEVDATLSTTFTVAGRPIAERALPAGLKITGIDATAGAPVSVRGTTASGLSGSISLSAVCSGSSSRTSVTAAHGRFSGQLRLPRLCIPHDPIVVTATWAGDSDYASGKAVGKASVDPAGIGPASRPLLFSRIVRVPNGHRDVFAVRPHTITVGSLQLDVHWQKWTRRGAYATGTAHPVHAGQYQVAVRAFHLLRDRFACLAVARLPSVGKSGHIYGLGRIGSSTFAWLGVAWLHRRASGATPWPHPGCPG